MFAGKQVIHMSHRLQKIEDSQLTISNFVQELGDQTKSKGQLLHQVHQALYKAYLVPSKDCSSLFLVLPIRECFLHIKQILQPVVKVHTFVFENIFCSHPLVVVYTVLVWKDK
jgi:hypothetical protein